MADDRSSFLNSPLFRAASQADDVIDDIGDDPGGPPAETEKQR